MPYFPKVIWIQNFILLLTWNLSPSYGEKKLSGKCWYEGQYSLCLQCDLRKGPSVIKDCSIKMISLGIAADMHHLYQNSPEGLVENALLQPKISLWLSHIQPGRAEICWLPSMKPNLKCRCSRVAIFQAISPWDLTGIHLLIIIIKQYFYSYLFYNILDNTQINSKWITDLNVKADTVNF